MLDASITSAIPHREPFLFVDEIVERTERRIVCRKTFTGQEFFYAGHFPDFPLTPGVILCEAAMQAGAILVSNIMATDPNTAAGKKRVPVATRANDVRFKRMVRPGESIEIEVDLSERLADAFFFKAKVTCNGQVAVRFEFACTLASVE